MQFQRQIKLKDRISQYHQHILKYDVVSTKTVCAIGCVYMLAFFFIDISRKEDFNSVLICRGLSFTLMAGLYGYLKFQNPKTTTLQWFTFIISTAVTLLHFLKDHLTGSLNYSLPNTLCLLFYVINAGLTHPIRFKIAQTVSFLLIFAVYSTLFSPFQAFHQGQIINITINAIISITIGALLERYKQSNFIQREKLIHAKESILELDALKTKLISVISHDTRSPIDNLKKLIELKESRLIDENEFDIYFSKVKKTLEIVSTMLNDLTKWSHLQLGGLKPDEEKINLHQLLHQAIDTVRASAMIKKIEIENQIGADEFLVVDSEILKIASRNLLSNAIKYSYENSKIIVRLSKTHNTVSIAFQDFGVGMTAENLKKIFTLNSISKLGTRNERGTGIGLIITREFISKIDGAISVDTAIGVGSTFIVTIPRKVISIK